MNRRGVFAVIVMVAALAAIAYVPLIVATRLLTGWISFAINVVPQLTVRFDGLAVGVAAFVFAVSSGHYLLHWLVAEINRKRSDCDHIRWRLRSTVALVVLTMLLFCIGIAMTGVTHQVGWLITSPDPIYVSKTQTVADSEQSTYRPDEVSDSTQRSWLYHALVPWTYMRPEDDESLPWNAAENADAFRTVAYEALCPSLGNPIWSPDGFGLNQKAGNPEVFVSDTPLRFNDLDSLSDTVMAGEVNAAFVPWAAPGNYRSLKRGLESDWSEYPRGAVGYGSVHASGALMLMADGSVRYVENEIDSTVLEKLGQRKK